MRVHTELVYGHIADKPATGTSNFHRKCSPYPFSGEVAVQSPACDFYLRLQGFKNIYVYFTGEPTQKTTCKDDSMAGFLKSLYQLFLSCGGAACSSVVGTLLSIAQ